MAFSLPRAKPASTDPFWGLSGVVRPVFLRWTLFGRSPGGSEFIRSGMGLLFFSEQLWIHRSLSIAYFKFISFVAFIECLATSHVMGLFYADSVSPTVLFVVKR